jgi:hypothetical protein
MERIMTSSRIMFRVALVLTVYLSLSVTSAAEAQQYEAWPSSQISLPQGTWYVGDIGNYATVNGNASFHVDINQADPMTFYSIDGDAAWSVASEASSDLNRDYSITTDEFGNGVSTTFTPLSLGAQIYIWDGVRQYTASASLVISVPPALSIIQDNYLAEIGFSVYGEG